VDAIAWAGLLLAAMALIAAFLSSQGSRVAALCERPRELRAEGGWTTLAGCGDLAAGGLPIRGPVLLLFGGRIDVNRADARTLDVLPGIGASRAAAIVSERSRGPFRDLSDLERVSGIGPRTVAGLRPWAQVLTRAEVEP
jgi:competence ComEA-like helix-hairpin-helix protein